MCLSVRWAIPQWEGWQLPFVPGASRLSGEESACQCRRHRRLRFDPWVRKTPCRRNGNPLQYSCLENPMDRGTWRLQSMGSQRVRHDLATKHTCSLCSKNNWIIIVQIKDAWETLSSDGSFSSLASSSLVSVLCRLCSYCRPLFSCVLHWCGRRCPTGWRHREGEEESVWTSMGSGGEACCLFLEICQLTLMWRCCWIMMKCWITCLHSASFENLIWKLLQSVNTTPRPLCLLHVIIWECFTWLSLYYLRND